MHRSNRPNGGRFLVLHCCLATLALLLTGCNAVATSEGMGANAYDVVRQQPYSVEVKAAGIPPGITDADLAQAIEEAILVSGVFDAGRPSAAADYQLSVQLFSLERPAIGASMTVFLEMGWTLKRLSDDQIIWRESVASRYTADAFAAFSGMTRIKLATEGAARNNIRRGIRKLSELDL